MFAPETFRSRKSPYGELSLSGTFAAGSEKFRERKVHNSKFYISHYALFINDGNETWSIAGRQPWDLEQISPCACAQANSTFCVQQKKEVN